MIFIGFVLFILLIIGRNRQEKKDKASGFKEVYYTPWFLR